MARCDLSTQVFVTRWNSINDAQGTVTVNLSKELDASSEAVIAHALALTLRQFKGVADIGLQVDGKERPLSSLIDSPE